MSSSSNEEHAESSVFASILKPGSSLHPTFLAVLDGAFAFLFLVFVALAFLTAGNIHIFVLMGIELALWGSVKWVVNELKTTGQEERSQENHAQQSKKYS